MKNFILFSLLVVSAACFGGGKDKDGFRFAKKTEDARPVDDIAIVTTDGAITLAIRADSLRLRFSDSLQKVVDKDLDTAKVEGNGIGANIAKMVKKQVASSLAGEMSTPLGDIEDARYENGTIVFVYADKSRKQPFGNTKTNNKPLMSSFSVADAERFVEYVKGRGMNR